METPVTPETPVETVVPVTPEVKPADAVAEIAKEETLLGKETDVKTEEKTEKPASIVPDKYELKAPEGMSVDTAMLETFTPVFKELGITQEGAQKLAEAYAPILKSQVEAQRTQAIAEFDKISDGWKQDTIKELGADYMQKLAPASKLIDKSGFGKDIREMLEDTRLGNHPVMNKFLVWLGKSITADSFAEPNKQSAGEVSLYDHPTSQSTLKK